MISLATKGIIGGHGAGNINTKLTALQADVSFIRAIEGGRWKVTGNQMIFYAENNITETARFNLFDSFGVPTEENAAERVRV